MCHQSSFQQVLLLRQQQRKVVVVSSLSTADIGHPLLVGCMVGRASALVSASIITVGLLAWCAVRPQWWQRLVTTVQA